MRLIGLFWAPLTPGIVIGTLSVLILPFGVLSLYDGTLYNDKKDKIRGIVLTMLGLFCFSALAWQIIIRGKF